MLTRLFSIMMCMVITSSPIVSCFSNALIESQPVVLNESVKEIYGELSAEDKVMLNDVCRDASMISVIGDNSEEYDIIMVEKCISSEKDSAEMETIMIVVEPTVSASGSFSASGQDYGIAAQCVVSHTLNMPNYPAVAGTTLTFHSMTAKYTNLPNQSTTVTKMDYSVRLETTIGTSTYFNSASVKNPSSGMPYSKTLNSGALAFSSENPIVMLTLTYANGASKTYSGSLVTKR